MDTDISIPIVVDLDGTLTYTDTLVESIVQLLKKNPFIIFLFPFWLFKGRAFFKSKISSQLILSVDNLPYNQELLQYLTKEKKKGRNIFLATAAHLSIAESVSHHLGLFDDIIASQDNINLKGTTKLEKIKNNISNNFIYAGDSKADIPIWLEAHSAILVDTSTKVSDYVRSKIPIEKEIHAENITLATWLKAFRVHQWLKNLLLFIPLLTAFSFTEVDNVFVIITSFFAFSLLASGTYIFNDIFDLSSDRAHPRKKHRPFANGKISIVNGLSVAILIILSGMFLGYSVSADFFLMLLLYLFMTVSYSLVLKEYVLIDVIMLSILYTTRIIAGSVAIEVDTSTWLLAFSVFIFLSLALVKRCAELVSLKLKEQLVTQGRDYQVRDLEILFPLGIGSSLSAIVVFGLFINTPETQLRYETPELLWIVALGLIYWISRLWIKTSRGEMHDDPVIYAVKNRGSLITISLIILTIIFAHFISVKSLI